MKVGYGLLLRLRPGANSDTAVVQQLEKEGADASKIAEYKKTVEENRNLSISKRRNVASKYTKSPVFWSWDIPRTREGFHHYKAGIPAATKRAIAFAPYADLLWLETADPSVSKAAGFAGVDFLLQKGRTGARPGLVRLRQDRPHFSAQKGR